VIFNLDHEMETLHFIPNGEDPYPVPRAQSFWGLKAKNINEAFFFSVFIKKIDLLQENFE
jgi:hypothetical protein